MKVFEARKRRNKPRCSKVFKNQASELMASELISRRKFGNFVRKGNVQTSLSFQ